MEVSEIPLLILCGGTGTRLHSVTQNEIPKMLVPIADDMKFVDFQLNFFFKQSVRKFFFLVAHLGDQIEQYCKKNYGHLDISFVYEGDPKGTGGAVKNALPQFNGNFLLTYGDVFCPINLQKFLFFINSLPKDSSGLIGTNFFIGDKIETENISLDQSNPERVAKYDKESKAKALDLVEAGLSYINRNSFDHFLEAVDLPEKWSLEQEFFPHCISHNGLFCYGINQRTYDVGTPERLNIFREDYARGLGG